MILIRGIRGEDYARSAENGIIGFRDLLSTLLNTNYTGYSFSQYYEKYFVNTFLNTMMPPNNAELFNELDAKKLMLIFNNTIPYMYITYFHILNENSVKDWLKEFDDDMSFFYIEPVISPISNNFEGQNLLGRRMEYTSDIFNVSENEFQLKTTSLLHFINTDLKNVHDPGLSYAYAKTLFSIMLPLFTRVTDKRFNDTENEFRIIYKIPTYVNPRSGEFLPESKRIFEVLIDDSAYYYGYTRLTKQKDMAKICDMPLTAQNALIQQNQTTLIKEVVHGKQFRVLSQFKNVNIKKYVKSYGYIGNKIECKSFIQNALEKGLA